MECKGLSISAEMLKCKKLNDVRDCTDNNSTLGEYYSLQAVGDVDCYKCLVCPYMTLASTDIKFHWQTLHASQDSQKTKSDKSVSIKCPGCLGLFCESLLKTHLKSHHKMTVKHIQKLMSCLVQEFERNQEYIQSLPVVIQGVETVALPPLIEIAPEVTGGPGCLQQPQAPVQVPPLYYLSIGPPIGVHEHEVSPTLPPKNELILQDYTEIVDISTLLDSGRTTAESSREKNGVIYDSEVCEEKVRNKKEKKQSRQIAKRGRPYGSRSLGVVSNTKSLDEKSSTKELGYKCGVCGCGVRLLSPEKIAYHQSCHAANSKELHCPECCVRFPSVDTLHTHLWRRHKVDMELHVCDRCPYRAYSLSRLNNIHKKIHSDEKNYQCDTCEKAFKNSKQLANHRTIHRSEREQHACDLCPRRLVSRRLLERHVNAVHQGLRPFHCPSCSYTAATSASLLLHSRLHTGDKPFKCGQCSFRTSDSSSLRRHRKRHSQQRSYSCRHCAYSCIQASSLKGHLRTRHPGLAGMHACPHCPYRSLRRDDYDTHVACHEVVAELLPMTSDTDNKVSFLQESDRASLSGEFHETENIHVEASGNIQNHNEKLAMADQPASEEFPTLLLKRPVFQTITDSNLATNVEKFQSNLPIILVNPNNRSNVQTLNSHGNLSSDLPSVPRKKPKISVKSNLILKGPNNLSPLDLQRQLGFKSVSSDIRLGNPNVTFSLNNERNISNVTSPIENTSQKSDIMSISLKSVAELTGNLVPGYLPEGFQSTLRAPTSCFLLGEPSHSQTASMMQIQMRNSNGSDIKLENKPYISVQPEFNCVNSNDIYLPEKLVTYEMPEHTIPVQVPVKFESKLDITGTYSSSGEMFEAYHSVGGMENVSIIEELPASFDSSVCLDTFPSEYGRSLEEGSDIIVIDDTSCDIKSLPVLGLESKFEHKSLLDSYNYNVHFPVKHNITAGAVKGCSNNDSQYVKEKPRIISEVNISGEHIAANKLALKLECPWRGVGLRDGTL